jgi:DNA-binding FrmR family transcriptional regulator
VSKKTALDLDAATTAKLLARLHRVEGQVRAISRMIEQRRDCHTIAQQMGAAKSALERATVQLMTASFVQCLQPNGRGEPDRRELARLSDTFTRILG